jgi:hypothetical protein
MKIKRSKLYSKKKTSTFLIFNGNLKLVFSCRSVLNQEVIEGERNTSLEETEGFLGVSLSLECN